MVKGGGVYNWLYDTADTGDETTEGNNTQYAGQCGLSS